MQKKTSEIVRKCIKRICIFILPPQPQARNHEILKSTMIVRMLPPSSSEMKITIHHGFNDTSELRAPSRRRLDTPKLACLGREKKDRRC